MLDIVLTLKSLKYAKRSIIAPFSDFILEKNKEYSFQIMTIFLTMLKT